ncbi:MAG: hypothetical protein ACR2F8_13750 [Caulobacteraceae bacterium]
MDNHDPSPPKDLGGAFNLPLGDAQFNEIGALTVLWSQFEFLTEWAIYHLRNQTFTEGRRTTLPRDVSKRIGVLQGLAGDRVQPPERAELLAICDQGLKTAKKRNLAAHGNWWFHDDQGETCAVSWFKVAPEDWLEFLRVSELPALIAEVAAIGRSLSGLLERLHARLA